MTNAATLVLVMLMLCTATGHADTLTYRQHVRPILQRHCVPCHSEGGAAPFPLTEYRHVAKRARFVAEVVRLGVMPPWKANPAYRHFANQRLMSAHEKETLEQWIYQGAAEGESALPHDVEMPETKIPRPDITLSMQAAVPIPGTGREHYVCAAIPFEFDSDTVVSAIEFVPGNRSLAHHASFQVLSVEPDIDFAGMPSHFVYHDTASLNDRHDYGYFGLIGRSGNMPVEMYHGGWLPGSGIQTFPKGVGFRLPRKGVLLLRNLHYAPSPVASSDSSSVRLWFAGSDAVRTVRFAAFKPRLQQGVQHVIPADSIREYFITVRMKSPVTLLTVNPHMHLLGRYFRVWAQLPRGDTVPLVEIPDWDFNWQEFYHFSPAVVLPAGSVINAVARFDNTARNPYNPHVPPRDVFFERGMDDSDEMMRLVFLYLPYRLGDESLVNNPYKTP